jgi:hypothetical protein
MAIRDMVARHSNFKETRDFIPTPPYATRAFYEFVAPEIKGHATKMTAWDPAAGQGHMVKVMKEYRHRFVSGTDIVSHGPSGVMYHDFTKGIHQRADLILTNPPYALTEDFYRLGFERCNIGLGLLVRVQALEGAGRFRRIFAQNPPTQIAFFSDRIPFKTGVVVRKAPKMFFHVWLYWSKVYPTPRPPLWIPPNAQKMLEKDSDYA